MTEDPTNEQAERVHRSIERVHRSLVVANDMPLLPCRMIVDQVLQSSDPTVSRFGILGHEVQFIAIVIVEDGEGQFLLNATWMRRVDLFARARDNSPPRH